MIHLQEPNFSLMRRKPIDSLNFISEFQLVFTYYKEASPKTEACFRLYIYGLKPIINRLCEKLRLKMSQSFMDRGRAVCLYYYQQNSSIKQSMIDNQQKEEFSFKKQLRERQNKMLAFLYNADYQFAAERFDKKYDPHLWLKKLRKNQSINSEQTKRILSALSEKLHARIIREDVEADRALNKLETLWQNRKIQPFHRYYFQKFLFTTYVKSTHTLIKHEDSLIRNQQHIYFSIQRAILGREAALNQLSRSLKQLGPQDVYQHFHVVKQREVQRKRKIEQKQYRVHGYRALYRLDQQQINLGKTKMQIFSEDLNNYRKITMYIIQLITNWKEYMCSLTHDKKIRRERLEFYYHENNFLLGVLNDAKFVSNSFLANFYTFSIRNDPLFLRPLLNIQKKEQLQKILTFEQHQLKILIAIKEIEFNNIIFSIENLYEELESNIRNRKVIDIHSFNKLKNTSLDEQHKQSAQLTPFKKIKLNPIATFKSESLKKLALAERQTSQTSLTKSNVMLRKLSQIETKTPIKTFYSNRPKNNPQNFDPYKILNSQDLLKLKEQVFEKIRAELQFQTKKSIIKTKEFQELVDVEVKANLAQMLQKQRSDLNGMKLQITPLSLIEEDVGSFITEINKAIPLSCLKMQKSIEQIARQIYDSEFCYIFKIHTAKQTYGHVIGKVNRDNTEYNQVQILYVSFLTLEILQRMILQVVEFMWKYENLRELFFKFTSFNSYTQTVLKQLNSKLKENCTVITKKKGQNEEYSFIFNKKGNNQNYAYNPYPLKMHFKLYCILTTQALKVDSILQNQEKVLYYDYVIMEMLKLYTNSQDFIVLRDTFRPKDRFRHLLKLMLQMQNHKDNQLQIIALSAQNVSQLNEKIIELKKPLLEIFDLVKINNIKALLCELTLSPSYRLKLVCTKDGVKMHRYSINSSLECLVDSNGNQMLLLDLHESHHQKIMIFKTEQYFKSKNKTLNSYLYEKIQRSNKTKKIVKNLWIEMARYPLSPSEQQQSILNTFESYSQFATIDKHLYLGDYFDWFTNMKIQNGVSYQLVKGDLVIGKPFGIGVIARGVNLIYSRIFQ